MARTRTSRPYARWLPALAVSTAVMTMTQGGPAAAAPAGAVPAGAVPAGAVPAGAAPAAAPVSAWRVVPSPNPGSDVRNDMLEATAAITADDVWAVGLDSATPTADNEPLTVHWNGTDWRSVPSPNPGGGGELTGVAAAARDDVWAVGVNRRYDEGISSPIIQHWNGTAWQLVAGADLGLGPFDQAALSAVTVLSAHDVWATGWVENPGTGSLLPLFEHWDGHTWEVSPVEPLASNSYFFPQAISAVSTTDIWAVGDNDTGVSGARTLAMHFNGKEWSVVATPNPFAGPYNELHAVRALATNDVWAVGEVGQGGFGDLPLIAHWNGSTWKTVPAANPKQTSRLFGIAAVSATDVLIVGDNRDASGRGATAIQRWNGSGWSTVASPNGTGSSLLFGVSTVGRHAVTVGVQDAPSGQCCSRTLVLQTDTA